MPYTKVPGSSPPDGAKTGPRHAPLHVSRQNNVERYRGYALAGSASFRSSIDRTSNLP